MIKNIKTFIIVSTMAAFSSTSFSQKTLSLEETRNLALEFNKTLKISSQQKIAAESQKKAAFTNYLPKIEASGNAMYFPTMEDQEIPAMTLPSASDPSTASDALFPGLKLETENLSVITGGVNLVQPIYAGGKIRLANKMTGKGVEIAEQAYQLKEAEVIAQTDEAYWNLAAIKEKVKLAEKYVLMLDSLEGTLNDSYELGLAPKSEKLKVTVNKNDAELKLLRARNAYRIMQMNLCRIIGLPLNTAIEITDQANEDPILPDFQDATNQALNNRQELQILDGKKTISEYQKQLANADFLPQLGAQVGYQHYKIADLINEGNLTVAASLTIPIFHWNERKHKSSEAKANLNQAMLELSNTQDLIQLEVQQAQIQLQEGYEYVLLSQKNKLEAKESLEETTVSFEVGLNTTTDLLNAQASWQDAVAQEIEALAQFEILKTKYKKVIGLL